MFLVQIKPSWTTQSFCINGWGADYNDPKNYLGQTVIGNDNAWYSSAYSNINKVEEEADKITKDMDARYEAFADAEAYTLEKAHMLPCYYNVGWCLTRYNVHAEFSGSRIKKQEN